LELILSLLFNVPMHKKAQRYFLLCLACRLIRDA
jgi:hypothetical protein